MTRVIRSGGRVVILEIVPMERNGLLQRLIRLYFHRVVPVLGGILTGGWDAYSYLPRSVDVFPKAHELVKIMETVGLGNIRYRTVGLGSVAIHAGEKP